MLELRQRLLSLREKPAYKKGGNAMIRLIAAAAFDAMRAGVRDAEALAFTGTNTPPKTQNPLNPRTST